MVQVVHVVDACVFGILLSCCYCIHQRWHEQICSASEQSLHNPVLYIQMFRLFSTELFQAMILHLSKTFLWWCFFFILVIFILFEHSSHKHIQRLFRRSPVHRYDCIFDLDLWSYGLDLWSTLTSYLFKLFVQVSSYSDLPIIDFFYIIKDLTLIFDLVTLTFNNSLLPIVCVSTCVSSKSSHLIIIFSCKCSSVKDRPSDRQTDRHLHS